MEELITIATFYNPTQAYLLKAKLESEGIICVLNDEYMNSLMPLSGFGGVKLQVYFSDSFRALDLYYELQNDFGTTEI
jgi:hypothetical protein